MLNELAAEIHQTAKDHGWWDNELMMRIHALLKNVDITPADNASETVARLTEYSDIVHLVSAKCHERSFGDMIALAHSELSEALEEYRNGKPPLYHEGILTEDQDLFSVKPEGAAVELVDCLIRLLDTLQNMNVDIDYIMKWKMTYNNNRPYRHGGKVI